MVKSAEIPVSTITLQVVHLIRSRDMIITFIVMWDDLDRNKAYICNTYQVYKDYSLTAGKPVEHFWFNDKAV